MNENELVKNAFSAKQNSYSPYSRFRVGAAVLSANGKIYTGCNIENVSYGATICAERTAVFNAVSSGEIKITAIAIASDSDDFILPCGICRQVLAEFDDKDMKIICTRPDGQYRVYTLDALLPEAFSKINIKGD